MTSRRSKSKSSHGAGKAEDSLTADPYQPIHSPATICSAADHTTRKNCSKNPWCVYGFGEREGVWRNILVTLKALGADPSSYLRTASKDGSRLLPPAGLKNLGATCYLNVLIQSLFHNLLVQDTIFNLAVGQEVATPGSSDTDAMREAVAELQRAFAHMKLCCYGVVDLSRFVKLLGLDENIQQDPEEFNNLFFNKIEGCKFQAKDSQVPQFGDLFCGKTHFRMKCLGCGQMRDPPDNAFHELNLSVEGVHSVEEALQRTLSVESLTGDNRYACNTCGKLSDAERGMVITATPTMLCLNLLRYSYDRQTYERKKLSHDVTFPDTLTVNGDPYRLTSVLYHKGRTAYGGHYVCDALDWESGAWWHYDDDKVVPTTNPAVAMLSKGSETQDSGLTTVATLDTAASSKVGAASGEVMELVDTDDESKNSLLGDPDSEGKRDKQGSDSNTKRRRLQQPTKGGLVDVFVKGGTKRSTLPAPSAEADAPTSTVKKGNKRKAATMDLTGVDTALETSAPKANVNRKRDAYMLTYVKVGEFQRCLQRDRCAPDPELLQVVEASSQKFLAEVAAFNLARDSLLAEIDHRKEVFNSIRDQMTPRHSMVSVGDGSDVALPEERFYLVPADWLLMWIKGDPRTFKATAEKVAMVPGTLFGMDSSDDPEVVILDSQPSEAPARASPNGNGSSSTVGRGGSSSTGDHSVVPVRDYLCCHRKGLDIAHQDKVKVISAKAYDAIFGSSGAWQQPDHVLTHDNFACGVCRAMVLDRRQAAHSQAGENLRVLELIEATSESSNSAATEQIAGAGNASTNKHRPAFWLQKTWLTQFRRVTMNLQKVDTVKKPKPTPKKAIFGAFVSAPIVDSEVLEVEEPPPSQSNVLDPQVNSGLFCEHALPALSYRKKAIKVSGAAWALLEQLYPQARKIAIDEICCLKCEEATDQQNEMLNANREQRSSELDRLELKELYKMKRIYPSFLDEPEMELFPADVVPPTTLYAVDGKWLAHWRKYVHDPNFPSPGALTNHALRCDHGRALLPEVLSGVAAGLRPQEHDVNQLLVYKFQEGDLGANEAEAMCVESAPLDLPLAEVVTEEQWTSLLEIHGKTSKSQDNGAPFTCRLMGNSASFLWAWDPEICSECMAAHTERRQAARTTYTNATVSVVYLRDADDFAQQFGKNADGTPAAATAQAAQPVRTSKRTRGRRVNSTICADSTDVLWLVRMKIYEALATIDLAPNRQRLYSQKGTLLEGSTLSACGVHAGDTIYVMEGEWEDGSEDWQVIDTFHGLSAGAREKGFTGTLLTRTAGPGSSNSAPSASSTAGDDAAAADLLAVDTVEEETAQSSATSEDEKLALLAVAAQQEQESAEDAEWQNALQASLNSAAARAVTAVERPVDHSEPGTGSQPQFLSTPPESPIAQKRANGKMTPVGADWLRRPAVETIRAEQSSVVGGVGVGGGASGSSAEPIDIMDTPPDSQRKSNGTRAVEG